MTNNLTLVVFAIAGFCTASCVTVAPVHGNYEKAGTLGKGNLELSGNYSHYVAGAEGNSEPVNNNIGVRAGIGLSDKIDLKIRYEKLMPVASEPDAKFKANYFSLVPKFNFVQNKLSLFVPLSMYRFKVESAYGNSKSTSYSIAPHLIHTFTTKSNQIDFSTSFNLEYLFNADDNAGNNFLMGLNVGAGFSNDLRKWAIRPEIGYLFDPSESGHVWNFGVGLQVILPTSKKSTIH